MGIRKKGVFFDPLTKSEVANGKKTYESLKDVNWAKKLLNDNKIKKSISIKPNSCRKVSDLFMIKSALFELRFAGLINSLNLIAEYEYKTGVGYSSIDFKIEKDKKTWLIELTSLKESKEVKKNTKVKDNFFCYFSITKKNKNSPEVFDLIKVQSAIINKTINSKGHPTKFNKTKPNTYNLILVDMSAFNAGSADYFDYINIAYGSKSLLNPKGEFSARYWIDEKGNSTLIKGLFDKDYPDKNARYVRNRIHAIGFVLEKNFSENKLNEEIIFLPNPKFFKNIDVFRKIWGKFAGV